MPEYTYKDIIIDPTSDEAKNYIGKEIYFSDNIRMCLCRANNDINGFMGILNEINENDHYPFKVNDNSYQIIIPKKEEPKPEYVPFEIADEFLDAYEDANYSITNGTIENRLLNHGGIWIRSKDSSFMGEAATMIIEICYDGIQLGNSHDSKVLWDNLFEDYEFLDGTPCGKINE